MPAASAGLRHASVRNSVVMVTREGSLVVPIVVAAAVGLVLYALSDSGSAPAKKPLSKLPPAPVGPEARRDRARPRQIC